MVNRLIKFYDIQTNPNTVQERLESFLTPTAVAQSGTKPTITTHYADGYKLVDNFDQLLSLIKYPFKLKKPMEVWFIHTILLLIVNSWVVWNDLQAVEHVDNNGESLKQFVKNLCDEVLGK